MFNEKRNQFPAEELVKYAGQHVAWSRDGTRILAGGEDLISAIAKLQGVGICPDEVVWSYVPAAAEESLLPSLQDVALESDGLRG